jgi:hypothetical protein
MSSNQIPGVPEGWEAVSFDYVSDGECWLDKDGDPIQHTSSVRTQCKRLIIRKIEKPARYRPFKDAEEFKPHRDRWLTRKGKSDPTHLDGACRVVAYCDNHLWWADGRNSTYKDEFYHGRCFDDDGTPFGVKIEDTKENE